MKVAETVKRSLVVSRGALIRVYVAGGQPFWLRDGLVGTDDPHDDLVHWSAVVRGRLSGVTTLTTTDEQSDLLQALIDAGLYEAGIADVPPKPLNVRFRPAGRRRRR